MYCQNCGRELNNDEKFCQACGTPTGAGAQTSNQSQGTDKTVPVHGQGQSGFSDQPNPNQFYSNQTYQNQSYQNRPNPNQTYPDQQIPTGMPSADGNNPGKKKKTVLLVTLIGLAVAAAATAAVLWLFVFNWERDFQKHVEERNWEEAGALYEKRVSGNEKREEKADEILREAVDLLKEGYDSDSMEYAVVERHLEAVEEFWDDPYVRTIAEELRSTQGQNEVIGTWRATEVEAMGVSVRVDEYLESMGMGDMKIEMSIEEDGSFSMDMAEERFEGTWEYSGSILTLTVDGSDEAAVYEDGKLTMEDSDVKIVFEK